MVFTLTNKFSKKVQLSLEPEGTVYELLPGHSTAIELKSDKSPAIDLQIQEVDDVILIAVWPEHGSYQLFPFNYPERGTP